MGADLGERADPAAAAYEHRLAGDVDPGTARPSASRDSAATSVHSRGGCQRSSTLGA